MRRWRFYRLTSAPSNKQNEPSELKIARLVLFVVKLLRYAIRALVSYRPQLEACAFHCAGFKLRGDGRRGDAGVFARMFDETLGLLRRDGVLCWIRLGSRNRTHERVT